MPVDYKAKYHVSVVDDLVAFYAIPKDDQHRILIDFMVAVAKYKPEVFTALLSPLINGPKNTFSFSDSKLHDILFNENKLKAVLYLKKLRRISVEQAKKEVNKFISAHDGLKALYDNYTSEEEMEVVDDED